MSATVSSTSPKVEEKAKRARWKTAVAGITGNLSIVLFQPLENVKLRLQANDGMKNHHLPKYQGVIDTFKTMWAKEGLVAFYRGMFVNIAANAVSGGLFFGIFADGKKRYNYDRETSPLWLTIWISLRAGLVTMTFVNPIWCVKTRVTLHWNEKGQRKSGYQLCKDTVKEMYYKEGIKSFFRGLSASLMMSFYGVIQMTVYEKLSKLAGIPEKPPSGIVTPDVATFFVGGTSRCVASVTFYPIVLMKTRLQKQRYSGEEAEQLKKLRKIKVEGVENKEVFYTTLKGTAKNIWVNEGIRGFYKG